MLQIQKKKILMGILKLLGFIVFAIFLIYAGGSYKFAIIIVGFGIYSLIRTVRGEDQPQLTEYMKSSDCKEESSEKLDTFFKTAPYIYELQYDSNYLSAQVSETSVFGETAKLVWAYKKSDTNHKFDALNNYYVALIFTNGKLQKIPLEDSDHGEKILRVLEDLCPKALIGYSDEYWNAYLKGMDVLMSIKYMAEE